MNKSDNKKKKEKAAGRKSIRKKMNIEITTVQSENNEASLYSIEADAIFALADEKNHRAGKNVTLKDGDQAENDDVLSKITESASNCEKQQFTSEAEYHDDGERIYLSYMESKIFNVPGERTTFTFLKKDPSVVTLSRNGEINTALVFERNTRHKSVYETQYMPLEVCTYTRNVVNTLKENGGTLVLDYIIELKGATAQETHMKLTAR